MLEREKNLKVFLRSFLPRKEGFLYLGSALSGGFLTTIPTFLAIRHFLPEPENEGVLAISVLVATIVGQFGAFEVLERIRHRRSFWLR